MDEIKLKKFTNQRCPNCNLILDLELVKKQVIGTCKNDKCKKIWLINKDNVIEVIEVSGLIEFYVELPFNLSIPTGLYSFDKPKQIMVRRDMYHLQRGNELENIQTCQPIYAPQDKLFNEYGLFKEEFKEYKFKRKMRTVLFKKYPVISLINKNVTIEQLIETGFFNSYIYKTQNQFFQEINEYLKYFSIFLPENTINVMYQHEIRPISIYEFSKCIFDSHLIINKKYYPVRPIIPDSTNLKGIPDTTYLTNNNIIEEFDRILTNRNNNPILPHQELFILARSLYRTNRIHMGASVITTSISALESLIHKLEDIHPKFQNLKKLKKKWEHDLNVDNIQLTKYKNGKGGKSFSFLEFYTFIPLLLAKLLKENYTNDRNKFKIILTHLKKLNIARWIRNEITHSAKFILDVDFNYDHEKGFNDKYMISYKNKSNRKIENIEFSELWESILKIYDYLDKILLNNLYPQINWNLKTHYRNEIAARSTKPGKGFVQVLMNIDWRAFL